MPILGVIASSMLAQAPVAPVLWLDASDTSTISLSGSAVTEWRDKSGNAYAFAQGTSGYRPVSGTETQNGKNVIVFGTDDLLQSTAAASVWKFLHSTVNTIFVAVKPTSSEFILTTNADASGNIGINMGQKATNALEHNISRGVGGSLVCANRSANNSLGTAFTYVTILVDPANATAANRSDIRFEQGAATKNNVLTNAVSTSDPNSTLRIGASLAGRTDSMVGQIGEILIYGSKLSAAEVLTVQQDLAAKWNV